jgi:hypothetical protein
MLSGATGPSTAATMPSKFDAYGWPQKNLAPARAGRLQEGLDEDTELMARRLVPVYELAAVVWSLDRFCQEIEPRMDCPAIA